MKKQNSFKKCIKKRFNFIIIIRNNIRWFFTYKKLIVNHTNISEFIPNKSDKIIIIAPHADDELISSYQLITKYKNNIELFYCGYTGYNDNQSIYDLRLSEFISFWKSQNVKYYISSRDVQQSLNQKLSDFKPDYVFIPYIIDWHSEHRKISEMLLKSDFNDFTVVFYTISVPINNQLINYYVPMEKNDYKKKWNDFYMAYKSQKSQPVRRYKYNERINKIKDRKIYASEVFAMLTYKEFKKMATSFQKKITKKNIQNIKDSINDLCKVRVIADEIYELIKG